MADLNKEQELRNRATLLGMLFIDWLGVFVDAKTWGQPNDTEPWLDPETLEPIPESEKLDRMSNASNVGLRGMGIDLSRDTPNGLVNVHVTHEEHEVRATLLGPSRDDLGDAVEYMLRSIDK